MAFFFLPLAEWWTVERLRRRGKYDHDVHTIYRFSLT